MTSISTKYGVLEGITRAEYYSDHQIKSCMLNKENRLVTPYGTFIPQYTYDSPRKKYRDSLTFYSNGVIKSFSLETQSDVNTQLGTFPAELITFYDTGQLKRLFPLNGKISGFWTEENEFELAPSFEFNFSFGTFKSKIIHLHFYESGSIKSLMLWPKEKVTINTSVGQVTTHTGFSLYPNGSLKSIEPHTPLLIDTPIGSIKAFDLNAIGIHADQNSLTFYENGQLKGLTTSSHIIEIHSQEGTTTIIKPSLVPNMFNPELLTIRPYTLEFSETGVTFNGDSYYPYEGHQFMIMPFTFKLKSPCQDCSSCSA